MATQIQRILSFLGKASYLCDDCIARACAVPQRQTVNGICRDNPEKIGRIDPGPKPCAGCRKDYKIRREGLNDATKFLAVYDLKKVRDASEKWMTSFRKAHDGVNIEFAEGVNTFRKPLVNGPGFLLTADLHRFSQISDEILMVARYLKRLKAREIQTADIISVSFGNH